VVGAVVRQDDERAPRRADGDARLIRRRETVDDLLALEA
jgi:hypothetical protein